MDDENNAWIEFDLMGQNHHIDFKHDGDYVHYYHIVPYLNELLKKVGNPRRFVHPYDTGDQTAVISFLTYEEYKGLEQDKGWPMPKGWADLKSFD